MKKSLPMFLAGLLAGAVVVGGVGVVSAVTSTDKPVVACADKKTGAMRYSSKGTCKKSERSLALQPLSSANATQVAGPAGPKGDTGASGPKGDTGAVGLTGAAGTGLNTIPSAFGSKTLIQTEASGCCDLGNNHLFVTVSFKNRTGQTLNFPTTSSESYQLWVDYFDANGEPIPCNPSCAFAPRSVINNTTPTCPASFLGEFTYDLAIQNIHAQRPAHARFFALQFRVVTNEMGTILPGYNLPIVNFVMTPTEEIVASGSVDEGVVRMAC